METARLDIADRSGIGAARSATRRMCAVAGFDDDRVSTALIVASELATNLVLHAGQGSFLARGGPGVMTLVAWDAGPGIPDVARAFEDGYSTAGTQGSGLGAIRRLADAVRVWSVRDQGTVVVADLGPRPQAHAGFVVDGLAIPMAGEGPSGDAYASREDDGALTILLADGLGHGEHAAAAADAAIARLTDGGDRDPGILLEEMGRALRRTRGAAVGIARLEPEHARVRFAGVGNVTGVLCSQGGRRTMLGHHGIVGRERRRTADTSYPLAPGDTIVLHTDGVREGWTPAGKAGVLAEDALVVAASIVRDGERGRDDVGVVVARVAPGA